MNPVMAFGDKLYHLMFAKVMREFRGDAELAHDSAAEVWLAAARKTEAFKGEPELVGYCLFRCVKVAIDLKRRYWRFSGSAELLGAVAVDESQQRRDQARENLTRAVANLPDLARRIIELYYYEGFSDRAIAAHLFGDSERGDARRKAICRKRQAAERSLRLWLDDSGLDYADAVAAFAARPIAV